MLLLLCLLLVGNAWANCFCNDVKSSTLCTTNSDCDYGIECVCYPTNFIVTPTPAAETVQTTLENAANSSVENQTVVEETIDSSASSNNDLIVAQQVDPVEHLQVVGSYTVGETIGIVLGLIAALLVVLLWGVYGQFFSLDPKINTP